MKHRFPINGLRHHDFKGRLDELYELAPGRRMSISIEHDNPVEENAVIVYCGKSLVGYVRSCERELACSFVKASGKKSLLGKVTGVDRDKRWLWLEIVAQGEPSQKVEPTPNKLSGWHFDGEVLPSDEAELRLQALLCNLETTVEQQEPWDDDMEQWLEYTEQNLWRDISCETSMQIDRILGLLTDGSKAHPEYEQKAGRLQVAIDAMGSPEVRMQQALQILQKAKSKEMDLLLAHYGDRAEDCLRQQPGQMADLFLKDGELFMGRLWYMHCTYQQTKAVKTLLAMMMRLMEKDKPDIAISIPEQWLLSWGTRQKDKAKAEVVREIVDTFEMERTKPKLAQQMQQMVDGCNTALQQTEAINHQTEALKAIAAKPATQINQLNMGNGTQLPPPDVNIPKLPKQ